MTDFAEIKPTGEASGDIRKQETMPEIIGAQQTLPVKLPFYKQPGFKRGVMAVANLATAFMLKNEKWKPAGEFMLAYVCPWLTTWALGSAMVKSGPSYHGDEGLWYKVRQVAQKRKGK